MEVNVKGPCGTAVNVSFAAPVKTAADEGAGKSEVGGGGGMRTRSQRKRQLKDDDDGGATVSVKVTAKSPKVASPKVKVTADPSLIFVVTEDVEPSCSGATAGSNAKVEKPSRVATAKGRRAKATQPKTTQTKAAQPKTTQTKGTEVKKTDATSKPGPAAKATTKKTGKQQPAKTTVKAAKKASKPPQQQGKAAIKTKYQLYKAKKLRAEYAKQKAIEKNCKKAELRELREMGFANMEEAMNFQMQTDYEMAKYGGFTDDDPYNDYFYAGGGYGWD